MDEVEVQRWRLKVYVTQVSRDGEVEVDHLPHRLLPTGYISLPLLFRPQIRSSNTEEGFALADAAVQY